VRTLPAYVVAGVLGLCCCFGVPKAALAGTPGIDGAKTVASANTVVNGYDVVTSANAGGRTIVGTNVANLSPAGLTPLGAGSVLMLYQANGATIDGKDDTSAWGSVTSYGNAGYYEFVTVGSVSGNTITLAASCNALTHSYTNSSEIVRVPQYSSLTIAAGGSIVATPWSTNEADGGIVAIDVSGATTINGSINVTGDGFAGAAWYLNDGDSQPPHPEITDYFLAGETGQNLMTALGAAKGESIAGTDATYDASDGSRYGRGAPANGGGGGNGHNTGGGGGANGNNGNAWSGQGILDANYAAYYADSNGDNPLGTADPGYPNMTTDSGGGRGGYSFAFDEDGEKIGPPYPVGGLGGRPMTVESAARVFFGGGGGAGDANNVGGGYGGNGGGIVVLNIGTLAGTGAILANGAAGGTSPYQDAGGGGGGGGSVVIHSTSGAIAAIDAIGGIGGNNDAAPPHVDETEGTGGGGGGGYVAAIGAASTISVAGGAEGVTQGPVDVTLGFAPYGATLGATGLAAAAPATFTYCYTPVIGLAKAATVVSNGNGTYDVTYLVTLENYGDTPLGTLGATDPLSTTFPTTTPFTIVTAPAIATSTTGASATVDPNFNGTSDVNLVTGGTLPVGGIVTLTFTAKITPPVGVQTYDNTASGSGVGSTGNAAGVKTADASENGTNPDPAANGNPAVENVVTPITVTGQPTLKKTVRNVTTGEPAGLTADTAVPGNQLEYTLSFANGTGGALSNFSVTDVVPAYTTYKSATCGPLAAGVTACTATLSGGTVTFKLTGTLDNGATQTFLLDVTVN